MHGSMGPDPLTHRIFRTTDAVMQRLKFKAQVRRQVNFCNALFAMFAFTLW